MKKTKKEEANKLIHHLIVLLQKIQNETYIEMINRVLDTPFFYFSYTYDLSHTLQRLHAMSAELNEVHE